MVDLLEQVVLEDPEAPILLLTSDLYYMEYQMRYNPIPLDDGAPVPTESNEPIEYPYQKEELKEETEASEEAKWSKEME